MAKMPRTLQLKRMVAVDGTRYPKITPLNVHTAMKAAFAQAKTVGDRHFPARHKVSPGKTCVFLEPVAKSGESVLFHVYVYIAGHTPDQVVQDFDAEKAEITADPIVSDGETKEVVNRFACLVFGDALIVENARVHGSFGLASMAIRELIRRHHNPKYPKIDLQDAPARKFKQLAALHGGVKQFTARVYHNFVPEPNSFGKCLETLFSARSLGKHRQLSATIVAEGDESLNVDEIEKVIDESEGKTGLSAISILFFDKSTLSDLDEYREKHGIEVQEVRPGVPAITEVESAIVDYLNQLVVPDSADARVIDNDGLFVES